MKENTAILVSSPFQALNALEAIKDINIDSPDFFVFGNDNNAEMTKKFVSERGYSYKSVRLADSAFNAIRNCREYNSYKRIIVGDFFSIPFFLTSLALITRHGQIIYVDDGNSTLGLLPPFSRKRLAFRNTLKNLFYKLLLFYKESKQVSRFFFTFFDVEGKGFPFPVIKNNFAILRGNVNVFNKDIYIIGTNTSQLQIARSEYRSQLDLISKYVKTIYPGENIFYCPHRRDLNQYDFDCESIGISMYNTKVSVEVDFATNEISPIAVIGFGSTALMTLKYMFPESNIIDLVFHHADETLVEEYRAIELEYRSKGIKVVELNDLCENNEHEINK